jgi:hypothetical protein
MIDYNEKFDRREPTLSLSINEIRELVDPYLEASKIKTISLLAGGFINSNYRLHLEDDSSLVLRISAKPQGEFSKALQEHTLTLVQSKRATYQNVTNTTRLIHCDYNPKNIMMRRVGAKWDVAGILDWEFSASGSPLVDLGNFLRFENESPRGFNRAFVEGYVSDSVTLVDNWREIAKLLDLAALVNFLESESENPKTFRTAVSVIKETIEDFRITSR